MCTCSTLLLFPYPVPADIHRSVQLQHVTLWHVPVDVLLRLFALFSQVKHFECHAIRRPQEVQCGLGCTSHLYQSLLERNWVRGGKEGLWGELSGWPVWWGCEGRAVRGLVAGAVGRRAVTQMCGSCGGELCIWQGCCPTVSGTCVLYLFDI